MASSVRGGFCVLRLAHEQLVRTVESVICCFGSGRVPAGLELSRSSSLAIV
ncbi:MAG TPA: hypothetical protein VLK65_15325 [Vicinamibacteria bacterium]|nr:hypothetical protein [Vicinamibacteria bacterium]